MEQANLYRMAALVSQEDNPISGTPNTSISSSHSTSQKLLQTTPKEKLVAFWNSIHEIEILRRHQVEHLWAVVQSESGKNHDESRSVLHRVCDPTLRPFLNPQVRNIVEQFPQSAETIVQRYGLEPEEFNTLFYEMQNQPYFRQNIQKYMK
jgi:hypothetical protein